MGSLLLGAHRASHLPALKALAPRACRGEASGPARLFPDNRSMLPPNDHGKSNVSLHPVCGPGQPKSASVVQKRHARTPPGRSKGEQPWPRPLPPIVLSFRRTFALLILLVVLPVRGAVRLRGGGHHQRARGGGEAAGGRLARHARGAGGGAAPGAAADALRGAGGPAGAGDARGQVLSEVPFQMRGGKVESSDAALSAALTAVIKELTHLPEPSAPSSRSSVGGQPRAHRHRAHGRHRARRAAARM